MDPEHVDALLSEVRAIADVARKIYHDVTEEEFDLESAISHYPVTALATALGIGILVGWRFARRTPPALLPPPPPLKEPSPLEYFERSIPEQIDRVREYLPELVSEDTMHKARDWLDTVVEPRLRETVENGRIGLGVILRRAIEGPDQDADDAGPPV
jgi:cytochrome P450